MPAEDPSVEHRRRRALPGSGLRGWSCSRRHPYESANLRTINTHAPAGGGVYQLATLGCRLLGEGGADLPDAYRQRSGTRPAKWLACPPAELPAVRRHLNPPIPAIARLVVPAPRPSRARHGSSTFGLNGSSWRNRWCTPVLHLQRG